MHLEQEKRSLSQPVSNSTKHVCKGAQRASEPYVRE